VAEFFVEALAMTNSAGAVFRCSTKTFLAMIETAAAVGAAAELLELE
jgi:hypothetical protein